MELRGKHSVKSELTARLPRAVRLGLGMFIMAVSLMGCASASYIDEAARREANDPIEGFNRKSFAVHNAIDDAALKPIAKGYGTLPEHLRDSLRNFFRNLGEPVTFANDLLQGNFKAAGATLGRATLNSTFGVLGFGDAAGPLGLEYEFEDFGQTLAVWGVPEGPYFFLPVFGPQPPRDLFGNLVDIISDPLFWANEPVLSDINYSKFLIEGVDTRQRNLENLDKLKASSLDYYASVRSLYRQTRQYEISNGKSNFEDILDLDEFQ